MHTENLIDSLTNDLSPVKRVMPATTQTIIWFLFTVPCIIIGLYLWENMPDFNRLMTSPMLMIECGFCFLTGILSAYFAFKLSVPNDDMTTPKLPYLFFAITLSVLLYQVYDEFSMSENVVYLHDPKCFAVLLSISIVPALIMIKMISSGFCTRPLTTMIFAIMSVSTFAYGFFRIFHALPSSLMVLVWNFGVMVVIILLGSLFYRCLNPEKSD